MVFSGARGFGLFLARARAVRVFAVVCVVVLAVLSWGARGVLAAGPCGSTGVYRPLGAAETCTYTSPGTEDTFTVPATVSSVSVTAIGAPGGAGATGGGGLGARVVNSALPVTPGSTLWVDVGQAGPPAPGGACASGPLAGGLFDGGAGNACGGGGGGSSALLTGPRASAQLTGNAGTDSRLLVAGAGGGGGAFAGNGGNAGDAALTGAGSAGCTYDAATGAPGGVGPTNGTNGGGAGCNGGANGSASSGGNGANGGGGGGGGWFGGGGAGSIPQAGGGGGSSYGGTSSGRISISTASSTEPPEVVVGYPNKRAQQAAQELVLDTNGVAPGTTLAKNATAIEEAVFAEQTATACADITQYLSLVKAQTKKTLTRAQARLLTTDANALASELGCT